MSGDNVIKGGLVVGLVSMSVAAQGAPSLKPQCVAQLQRDMDAIASQPLFNQARLGIVVQPLQTSQPLYTKDAQRYFLPASTTKVMTTAAALTQLGPKFRIQTDLYGAGTGPTLDHLRIVGRGDPTLSDQQLTQIAIQLKQKGIRQINHLLGDDTYFQGPGIVPSWEWEDLQAGYGAPVNSLILNQNAYELKIWPQALGQPLRIEWLSPHPIGPWRQINRTRTVAQNAPEYIEIVRRLKGNTLEIEIIGQLRAGAPHDRSAVAVIDPGWFLLKRFRAILAAHQITVGKLSLLSTPKERNAVLKGKSEQRLTQIQSPPLTTLIKTTNQESNNLYAEALVKTLGAVQQQSSQNTHQQGLKVLKQTLTQLGVNTSTYAVADGSGLSRQNLVNPQALTQTLKGILKSPHASTFQASLPKDSIGQNPASTLWSKSGGMRGVSTLTGYLQHPQSSPVLFSLMFNQYNQSGSKRRQAMDAMLLSINRWQSCQGKNR